jgi:hypothetical protein
VNQVEENRKGGVTTGVIRDGDQLDEEGNDEIT